MYLHLCRHRISINISQVGEYAGPNTFLSINAIWLIEIHMHEVTSWGPLKLAAPSQRRIGVLRIIGGHTIVGGPKEGADATAAGTTRSKSPVAVRIVLARAQLQRPKVEGVCAGGRWRLWVWVWHIGIFVHIIANRRRHQLRSRIQKCPGAHAPFVPPEFRTPILKPDLKRASK